MMRRVFLTGAFGVALAVLVAGPAGGDDKKNDDRKNDDKNAAFSDETFVKKAASSGMLEVKLSENAQSKVSNPEVRQFAAQMVKDHVKANNELKTAAQSASIPVPDLMLEEHQKVLKRFDDLKGENYDQEFVEEQVKLHEEAVKLFRQGGQELKNAQLKGFATQTLPTLEHHLQMAKNLQSKVKK